MSEKPIIAVPRLLMPDVMTRLEANYDIRLNAQDRKMSPDELRAFCKGATAVMACPTERFDRPLIEALSPSLKLIACHSVGVDNVDLNAARDHNIVVTNTPDVLNDATVEIAMLLLLGAARRASEGDRMIRAANWSSWGVDFMIGKQMTGARLGIVGMGRIGRILAKRARAFDMEIHYYNRTRLSPDQEQGAIFHATLESLLPQSDFLSLHCPSTPETRHLVNERTIALLPPGAVLVNTARGEVIDDNALIAALKSGHLAAAGLDVFEGEPNVNKGYLPLENVFLLPHIGSATHQTRTAMGMCATDNMEAWFAGKEPPNRVV